MGEYRPALSAGSDVPQPAVKMPTLSETAAKMVREQTAEIVPQLVEKHAQQILDRVLGRLSDDDLSEALSEKIKPKVKYFGSPMISGDVTLRSDLAKTTGAGLAGFATTGTGLSATTVATGINEVLTDSAASPYLKNWFSSALSGKKIAWVGDSTTLGIETNANVIAYRNAVYVTNAGSALTGVTQSFFSSNGDTLQNFIINATAGKGVSDVIAAAPNLVILSYGINDVRLGNRTKAQVQADLITAVSTILAALPTCDVVLRMPNSFLTTDVGGNGYVVPNGSAQAYSTILKDAYRALARNWPNVVLYDAQATVFPETCQATYLYNADQLHPNEAGYEKIYDELIKIAVPNNPVNVNRAVNKGFADHAQSVSFGGAHLTYPDVVLNGDYTLVTRGRWASQGSGFLRFTAEDALNSIGRISMGDIVVQNSQAAFAMPSGSAVTASAANVQLGTLGSGNPTYAQTGGYVEVWRPKYSTALGLKDYVGNATYQAQRRVIVATSGNTFTRIQEMPGESPITEWFFQPTDILYTPSVGATTLTSASFSRSGAQIQINKSGIDWTADANTIGFLFAAATPPLSDRIIRRLTVGLDMNAGGTDTTVVGFPVKYIVTKVRAMDASISFAASAASFGLFTAAGGGGTAIVADGTITALTAVTKFVDRTIAATTDYRTETTLFLRCGTGHGSAATVRVMIEVEEIT